jgi:hypothetical protein
LAVDAECILRIPLSEYQTDDFIPWHKSKKFIFSVRSAYYVEWEHQFGARVRRRDGQGSSLVNPVWENLWKLHVPGKVKFFLWRALHGFVPGMAILAWRHIKVHPQCPVCFQGLEDINHLLFGCLRACEVWKELGLLSGIEHAMKVDRSGLVVLEFILCSQDKRSSISEHVSMQELIAVSCWYIWWQRRQMVKGGQISTPASSAFSINALSTNLCVQLSRWQRRRL